MEEGEVGVVGVLKGSVCRVVGLGRVHWHTFVRLLSLLVRGSPSRCNTQ